MDAHSHTLDKFSIYRQSDGVQNAGYDTESDHAYARSVKSYRSWHVIQLDLLHIHRCAFSQNAPGFLQPLHRVVASFYLAQRNYHGLNGSLQGFANPHRHRPAQSAELPKYKVDRNSLMHNAAHLPTGNPAISRHWQYHPHIPVLRHPDWYRQNAGYTHL